MVQFAVALKEGEWTLFRNGEPLARGLSRSRTIERAEVLVADAREAGEAAELLLQDYFGSLQRRPN